MPAEEADRMLAELTSCCARRLLSKGRRDELVTVSEVGGVVLEAIEKVVTEEGHRDMLWMIKVRGVVIEV